MINERKAAAGAERKKARADKCATHLLPFFPVVLICREEEEKEEREEKKASNAENVGREGKEGKERASEKSSNQKGSDCGGVEEFTAPLLSPPALARSTCAAAMARPSGADELAHEEER